MRVGDYRVIYRIEKREVIVQIVKIGIRRDSEVYEEMSRRIPYLIDTGQE
ncbi:MAG: type II toxin-antitoxin system RelE/ParE family toxin [Deltaproteobacteria bacterium]|nr:type II toxin-antitoxin system RelE/ParE family toxin [Deltaproteobacteria bacterium]